MQDGRLGIIADPPLLVPVAGLPHEAERNAVQGQLPEIVLRYPRNLPPDRRYLLEQYRIVDMARKVVGLGSAAYLGRKDTFDNALADFAELHADQNEIDDYVLLESISSGRVKASSALRS